jgi:hypothetical protein
MYYGALLMLDLVLGDILQIMYLHGRDSFYMVIL